jgi:hypothetical protein
MFVFLEFHAVYTAVIPVTYRKNLQYHPVMTFEVLYMVTGTDGWPTIK